MFNKNKIACFEACKLESKRKASRIGRIVKAILLILKKTHFI